MNKKAIILVIFSLFHIILLFHGCDSSTSPTSQKPTPKPKASISIGVSQNPIIFICILGICVGNFKVIISENNGVGAQISSVKGGFISGNSLINPTTEGGGRIPPNGSLTVKMQMVTRSSYSKIRITVTGKDDNGYSISKHADFNCSYVR